VPTPGGYPLKRVGAGVLLRDPDQAVLLVKPTYKATWEIPGGLVEVGESPREAARRECQEELGCEITVGELLVVQYNPLHDLPTDDVMFIFDGGFPTQPVTQMTLPPDELADVQYVPEDQLGRYASASLHRRLIAALPHIARDLSRRLGTVVEPRLRFTKSPATSVRTAGIRARLHVPIVNPFLGGGDLLSRPTVPSSVNQRTGA
jgi:8-oxo-dGTP pyrophosphatase MutT (NUDIX family)